MEIVHVTWSTEGRLPFFPDEALRRRAVRKLVAAAGAELVVFCIVDEHVHVVLYGNPTVIRRRIRAITRSLRGLSVVPMASGRIRVVADRAHANNVFGYVLDQPYRHELAVHSALWSGNCLADLVGARLIGGMQLCHRDVWPRFRPADAFEAVDLPRWILQPVKVEHVSAIGAHRLVAAVAAAFCLPLPLACQVPEVVTAKRVACRLAREAGLPLAAIARAAGFSLRSAQRLARQEVPESACKVVLTWLALEQRVRSNPRPPRKEPSR